MPVASEELWSTEYFAQRSEEQRGRHKQMETAKQVSPMPSSFSVRVMMLLYTSVPRPAAVLVPIQVPVGHETVPALGRRGAQVHSQRRKLPVHTSKPTAKFQPTANGPPGRRSASKSRQLSVCLLGWAGAFHSFHLLAASIDWLSRPDKITQVPSAPSIGTTVRTPPQAGKGCVRDNHPSTWW
ncbi:hypothetical protein J3F84DRAFT_15486 [Trichoderma pleuroticola]